MSQTETEKLYTLKEAQIEIYKQVCANTGHDYEILHAFGIDGPVSIRCMRCGKSWEVKR